MNSPSELNPKTSNQYRLFEKFSREQLLVSLVAVNLLVTILISSIAWWRSEVALVDALDAKAQASTWQQMYKEAERESRLAQVEIDDFRIALIKAGIELEHGEKP